MKTLHRTMARGVSAGEALPTPYDVFDAEQISFRRGSVSMIAGPPGSMKTVTALNIVRRMGPDVPTIYHSSDSDDFTVTSRVLAMELGIRTAEAEELVMIRDRSAYEALKAYQHVRWSFISGPNFEHMQREAEAYRTLKGTYPHHTVVDILMNIDEPGAAEQNYWGIMAGLNDMAREQETAVTVIHHTSESAKAGSPPPRSAIMGKANQLPTTILTLWGDSQKGELSVAKVKNRFGPQDAEAKRYFKMKVDASKCWLEESDEPDMIFDSTDADWGE